MSLCVKNPAVGQCTEDDKRDRCPDKRNQHFHEDVPMGESGEIQPG